MLFQAILLAGESSYERDSGCVGLSIGLLEIAASLAMVLLNQLQTVSAAICKDYPYRLVAQSNDMIKTNEFNDGTVAGPPGTNVDYWEIWHYANKGLPSYGDIVVYTHRTTVPPSIEITLADTGPRHRTVYRIYQKNTNTLSTYILAGPGQTCTLTFNGPGQEIEWIQAFTVN